MTISNGYATLVQVKQAISMGTADTADDDRLELAIETASRALDDECERVFFASGTGVSRVFVPADCDHVPVDDLISISAVACDWDQDGTFETTVTDYRTLPTNGVYRGRPWPVVELVAGISASWPVIADEYPSVRVTGNYGFAAAVPKTIVQACVTLSARYWKRGDAVFGVAGFGDMGAVRLSQTDPDVARLVRPFRRSGSGVGFA
mgnify:FL=1